MNCKVSIVIPVYNVEMYLRECLNSVLNQSLKEFEVICVDDGSTDKSYEILQDFSFRDDRVIILKQQNKGAGAARNVGLERAKGKYVYFMDSDDYCDLNLLDQVYSKAELEDADITVFDFCRFETTTGKHFRYNGMNIDYVNNPNSFSYIDNPLQICSVVNPTPWNKLFRRDFLIKNNLRYLTLSTTNDITFATMSVLCAKKITYLPKTLYFYRIGDFDNITSKKRKNLDNVIEAVLSVDKQARKLEFYSTIKNSIRLFIAKNLFVALERYAGDSDNAYSIDFTKKMDSVFYSYPIFLGLVETDLKNKSLYEEVVKCRKRAELRNDCRYAPGIVVSMTSFPGRIGSIHKAIASIFLQTKKPDKVILWLAANQFPFKERELPKELLEYCNYGLEIRWCKEDLRPHKKYLYAMQEFPNDVIITVDDDLIYDIEMIRMLYDSYLKYPSAVSAMRTHLMVLNEQLRIAPYSDWIKEYSGIVGVPSMKLFSTSGAGTLYPPYCMDKCVFDKNAIKSLCLDADDIWLKMMQMLSGTQVVLVRKNAKLNYIDGTQEIALQNKNVFQSQNDVYLNNVIDWLRKTKEKGMVYFVDCLLEREIFKVINNKETYDKELERLKIENGSLRATLSRVKEDRANVLVKKLTYVPRKIRGGIRCYKEHGLKFTLKRIVQKIKNKF